MSEDHQLGANGEDLNKDGQLGRRRFLTWVTQGSLIAVALAATGQVLRFLSFQPPDSASTIIPVGQPEDCPRDTLVYVPEARAYIGHDRDGLYALDAVCTHLGCLVQPKEEGGFVCPCHDSHFDFEGRPESGPATQSLRYLHLWLGQEEGQLLVDRARQVEPEKRLIV